MNRRTFFRCLPGLALLTLSPNRQVSSPSANASLTINGARQSYGIEALPKSPIADIDYERLANELWDMPLSESTALGVDYVRLPDWEAPIAEVSALRLGAEVRVLDTPIDADELTIDRDLTDEEIERFREGIAGRYKGYGKSDNWSLDFSKDKSISSTYG